VPVATRKLPSIEFGSSANDLWQNNFPFPGGAVDSCFYFLRLDFCTHEHLRRQNPLRYKNLTGFAL